MLSRALVTLSALCGAAASASALVITTFEHDLDGWKTSAAEESGLKWAQDPEREGGCVSIDIDSKETTAIVASENFLGDWSEYSELMFDRASIGLSATAPIAIEVYSANGNHTIEIAPEDIDGWQRTRIDLKKDVFPFVDETQITGLELKTETAGIDGSILFDNILLMKHSHGREILLIAGSLLALFLLQRRPT